MIEMALSVALSEKSLSVEGVTAYPYRAVAKALEVIPRTLIQNCGGNAIRLLTALRVSLSPFVVVLIARQSRLSRRPGVWTETRFDTLFSLLISQGEIVDMKTLGIWEPYRVKVQTLKTAVEVPPAAQRRSPVDRRHAPPYRRHRVGRQEGRQEGGRCRGGGAPRGEGVMNVHCWMNDE
jgi:chaperonin GroEL (HSP60 family)